MWCASPLIASGQLINSNPALLSRIVGMRFDGITEVDSLAFIETIFVDSTAVWAHCIISVVVGSNDQIGPFPLLDGAVAHIGASIGIARFPNNGTTRQSIFAAADSAMYAAKKSGKNASVLAPDDDAEIRLP
jgi:predicted signal transduction protein with EAL and GGDEF domain